MSPFSRGFAGPLCTAVLLACTLSSVATQAHAASADAAGPHDASPSSTQPAPAGGLDALLAGAREEAESQQHQRAEQERMRQELVRAQAQARADAARAQRELDALREAQERERRAMRQAAEAADSENNDSSTTSVLIDSLNRAASELRATQRSAQAGYERAMRDAQRRQQEQRRQAQLQQRQKAEQRARELQQQIAQRESQIRQQQAAVQRQLEAHAAALGAQCRQSQGTWHASSQQCAWPPAPQPTAPARLAAAPLGTTLQETRPATTTPPPHVAGRAGVPADQPFQATAQAPASATRQDPEKVRQIESLAYCRSKGSDRTLNNREGWFCEGPLQKLWSSLPDLKTALEQAGCPRADHQERHHAYGEGLVFYCAEGLKTYDRDLARLLSLPGYVLVKRDIYTCDAAKAAGSAGCGRHSALGILRGAGY